MDRAEAKSILAKELTEFAARPYERLVASIKHVDVKNVAGESVANYQIEFDIFWDSKPDAIYVTWLRSTTAAGTSSYRSPIR